MVIGTFFGEVGTELLVYFSNQDPWLDQIRKRLIVRENWSDEEFTSIIHELKNYNYQVEARKIAIKDLCRWLTGKRDFLLRLLENPVLLEHESFSELLRFALRTNPFDESASPIVS